MSWRALSAVAGLVLVTSCAKIFGVDDTGTLSDGGAGQPCDMNSSNQTQCGQGLVCVTGNAYGTGNVCARTCTADQDCAAGQGCLAINQNNGGGGGSFVYACQANTSCTNGACGWSGTACSNGTCRDSCTIGNGNGPGMGTCPSDETCIPMCPTCNSGVCSPSGGSSSGGEGGTEGGALFAPLPEALTEMACAAGMDGKVYLFGGLTASHVPTKATYVYDPVANTWTSATPMTVARHGAGVGIGQTSGIFFVVGGFDATGGAVGANEKFNAFSGSDGAWTVAAPMPTALGGSAVEGIGMYLVAGGAAGIATPPVATVQSFQGDGQWSSQPQPMLETARKWMAAAQSSGGGMLAIGGFDGSGHAFPDVERFDGTMWSSVAAMPTARGKLAATAGPNQLVYVVGGNDGSKVLATVETYQSNSNQWQTLAAMPTAREGLCLAWVNGNGSNRLYAIGGDDGMGATPNPLTTVEAFDLGSNTWIR
ncbi:MAG TPA: kelch repeat-containing protein [Polyangiaceae bacterium]|nr:kelch repeat-containing protein [Polyangiaceae bacterium]